jgi:cobalt-zinc-cadmium resistance protein CzcA
MARTVAFALLGALVFSMVLAPVLSSFLFGRGAKEWSNPILTWLIDGYKRAAAFAIRNRYLTVGFAGLALALSAYLAFSGIVGSEFLPQLDEGSVWVRGTLAPSTGPDESVAIANKARVLLASFPEVTETTSQAGRADDGTGTTGFFNAEYYVGLKSKEDWRPVFPRIRRIRLHP